MERLWSYFRIVGDREDQETVIEVIKAGTLFRGTNLWVLIFAIFIASLGLNLNSTAVIIGAMLISPLMGPILGLGLAFGINDVTFLRQSFSNYLLATGAALATSSIYFALSPLNEAHSEILSRTSPNIYDVLIALFGGFAGMLATSSKNKGNVIPGVAIATALMPPLCTAGYGLATWQWEYFGGAFYLFVINTVSIALATFLTSRLLQFPYVQLSDSKAYNRTRKILVFVVVITLLPSLYFGYDMVIRNKFLKMADKFIELEAKFPNDYLLNKSIDAKTKSIKLVYGGEQIGHDKMEALKSKLGNYELEGANLDIKQGFSYLAEEKEEPSMLSKVLLEKEAEIQLLKARLDSNSRQEEVQIQLFQELKALRPDLSYLIVSPGISSETFPKKRGYLVLSFRSPVLRKERLKIEKWLKTRMGISDIQIIFH